VKDLSPVLRSIKDKNPDAFVGFTYPPDTILASRQAKEIGFNPKFFYASVGTAFQLYRNVMTAAGAEGVLGMGSWNGKTSPAPRPTSTPTPRSSAPQGARPLGQRRLLGGAGDPDRRGGKVGLDRKAIRDFVAGTDAQDHHRRDPLRRQRERGHAGHGEPVAERRVRGGVAEEATAHWPPPGSGLNPSGVPACRRRPGEVQWQPSCSSFASGHPGSS
jgi:hypothetical protein